MSRALFLFLILCLVACRTDAAVETPIAEAPSINEPPTVVATTAPIDVPLPTDTVAPTMTSAPASQQFDGERAFVFLEEQMAIGPRWPGSVGHTEVGDYIVAELAAQQWEVEEQYFDYQGFNARNIIGRANIGAGPIIILGAHYDTRRLADQTPGAVESELPVPGAVDGASGVAVLLEFAHSLDLDEIPREIWLTFFDVEDNGRGGLPGWDYIAGSTYMAENLADPSAIEAMVLVDMIGDADQQLFYEGNSDHGLRETLWAIADELGHNTFIPVEKYRMIDDHVPFVQRGITAVDIIDFDYPYWHTVDDTADKASAESLFRVGQTVEVWLETHLE